MYVKLHEIRQVTGARCLADGHSAAFLINSANREEMKNNKLAEMAEIEEDISAAEDDNARMDPPAESENKAQLKRKPTKNGKSKKVSSPEKKSKNTKTKASNE